MRRRQVTALAVDAWLVLGTLLVHRADAQVACGQALGSGIYAKWIATGGESGILGCPIGPEVDAGSSPQGTTGRFAEFRGGDGGFVVWHGSGSLRGRSFEVHGCNYKVYRGRGGTSSWLGYPVSDEHDAPGGKQSDFEGGAIQWDARTRECRAERRDGGGGGGGGAVGGEASGDCAGVEGTWQWFNGKSVMIRGGGRVDGPDDQATWQLVDPSSRRYRLQWGAGWVDELQLSADGRRLDGTNQTGVQVSATRECRGAGPGGRGTGGDGGGICADPRTLGIMDEWLARAVPSQKPGESLRYEPWGRLVGRSLTATLTTNGPPETPLTRCEWLWAHAAGLRSANQLGTLQEFVEQRVRGMV